jgi:hypothetical protein
MLDTNHPSKTLIDKKDYSVLQELVDNCAKILGLAEQNAFLKNLPEFQHLKTILETIEPSENPAFKAQPPDMFLGLFNVTDRGEIPLTIFDVQSQQPTAVTTLAVGEAEVPNLCTLCSDVSIRQELPWRLVRYIPVEEKNPVDYYPFLEMKGQA